MGISLFFFYFLLLQQINIHFNEESIMPSISLLKEKFDKLLISNENIHLYDALLYLDISDFKPVMEEILLGRIDIEDTRQLFSIMVNYPWMNQSDKPYDPFEKLADQLYYPNTAQAVRDNLMARLEGNDGRVIKEAPAFPNQIELKARIADEFFRSTGQQLAKEDIEKLLPIVKSELMMELSLYNNNAVKDKSYQLVISDLLSIKPKVTI